MCNHAAARFDEFLKFRNLENPSMTNVQNADRPSKSLVRVDAPEQHATPASAPITGLINSNGWNVRLVIVAPGQPVLTAEPGCASKTIDLEGGFRLVLISEGPTDALRNYMESFFAHRPRLAQETGPLDWAELERDVFHNFAA